MIGIIKDKKPIGNKTNGIIVTFDFRCPKCLRTSESVYSIEQLGLQLNFTRCCQNCNNTIEITELL